MIQDWPIVSDNPFIQAHYEKCRSEGTSHSCAEMFAFAIPPGCMTDAVFLEGECNGNQFAGMEYLGDYYAKQAAKAGVNVKGKVYKSGLARFPGDPEAWVSDRHDVQKVLESRGWGSDGAVKVDRRDTTEADEPTIAVADDIVEQRVAEILEREPGIETQLTPGEISHKAIEEIKPHWS